ncbi:MAG TPA: molybdenum cofactor guanylyltransferase [Actinomycetota bacterium]|nr:molybdenum cofactor guanylyltransferase [Actinomycetota bacterium]
MAGGRSSRFGRDKLAEPYRGMPLLHHAVIRLAEVCGDVVVVLGPDGPEPVVPPGAPVRFARDPEPAQGPLAGLYAGLLAVRTDHALVAAGDMPELRTAVLLEMLKVAAEASVDAVTLGDGDRFRPLPCVVRRGPANEAAHTLLHAGTRRLRDLFDALPYAVIDEDTWVALDPERRTLFDVDEASDLPDG